MAVMQIDIPDIPHGHGLSFKRGVADSLLDQETFKNDCHETHLASYARGIQLGNILKEMIANCVK